MSGELKVSVGQYSEKGRKESNQDFHGALIPDEPLLSSKGVAIAIADGISSSDVSHIASESAVKALLMDYYCTSEAWSVKTSAQRVLAATNSWLHSQTQRSQYYHDMNRGYVCTLSAMIVKSATAHIFHVGDARIYRLDGSSLEQLTIDHRVVISAEQSYLGRALGINHQVEIDYQTLPVAKGDTFVLATDGVYEHVEAAAIAAAIADHPQDLDRAARRIVELAFGNGSTDNLTAQILRIDDLPGGDASEVLGQSAELALPPLLDARMEFDGYKVVREVHASSRSHIYLAQDTESEALVILKIPSTDLRGDPAYLRRFLMEEWVARRITSAHVLKPIAQKRKRNFLYIVTEFIDGQTLTQWMIDHPKPDLETVRGLVEQIAKGLRAFHRLEMLHQDVRPENIMIDKTGTVKIIDFGSTLVSGVLEASASLERSEILGTAQYTAPEYFLGEGGTECSDIFSLGVIAYQMLTGRLPYGAEVAKARTRRAQGKLTYQSALHEDREIPAWVDGVLRKALHPDPAKRYGELSEFTHDLRTPGKEFTEGRPIPLMERNPLLAWKLISAVLLLANLVLLWRR